MLQRQVLLGYTTCFRGLDLSVADIQQAILELPKAEFNELLLWLTELEAEAWEKQIEDDSSAGKLDPLISEAMEAKEQGTLLDL